MYCSTCGRSVSENLNYCNNCGARTERHSSADGSNSTRPFALVSMLIGGGGLFGFFPLLDRLLRSGMDTAAIFFILLAYLVTVLLMFSLVMGFVWKSSSGFGPKMGRGKRFDVPDQLPVVNTAQLYEPRQPVASVTDHTTRTLENVPVREG
jgi:hypothetical protein